MVDHVAIMIVSHSHKIASGTSEMVRQMCGEKIKISFAGGTSDGELGTDVGIILKGLKEIWSDSGVVLLYDLGSAEMSSEAAIEMLPQNQQEKIKILDAPLVEGAIIAGVESIQGSKLEEVKNVIEKKYLKTDEILSSTEVQSIKISHQIGLHARPAVKFTKLAKTFEANIKVKLQEQTVWVDAKSIVKVMGLKASQGKILNLKADGRDANESVKMLTNFVQNDFVEK